MTMALVREGGSCGCLGRSRWWTCGGGVGVACFVWRHTECTVQSMARLVAERLRLALDAMPLGCCPVGLRNKMWLIVTRLAVSIGAGEVLNHRPGIVV